MRIALLSAEYPPLPGGVGDYTAQLGAALRARGHAISVLTGNRLAAVDDLLPVVALPTSWGWQAWRAIRQALQSEQPDLLHLQYQAGAYHQHPAINLLPWYLRRTGWRKPIMVTLHDLRMPYLFPKADWVRRWVMRRLTEDATSVIVTNQADRQRLTGAYPADREQYTANGALPTLIPIGSNIAVAPPLGYERAAWRHEHGFADRQVIAHFGLMNASKGLTTVVEALAALDPQSHLLIIGGTATTPDEHAYATEVKQLSESLGVAERITITGACPPAQVSAYLLACDVVALPFTDGASYRRGSLLAALTHGCSVVTTPPTVALDPPLAADTAVCFTPSADPVALAQTLRRVLNDPALQARLRIGSQAVAAQFAWPTIAAAHEAIYAAVAPCIQ